MEKRNHPLREPSGFTLVEMMIVVLMMGILAMAATPAMDSALSYYNLVSAAEEIKTAVEYAQSFAMMTGVTTRFVVDTSREKVQVEQLRPALTLEAAASPTVDEDVVETTTFTVLEQPIEKGKDYVLDLSQGRWVAGVDISAISMNEKNWITFDALGMPSSEGKILLAYGGTYALLHVEEISGKVTYTTSTTAFDLGAAVVTVKS